MTEKMKTYKSMAEFIAIFGEYPLRSTKSEYYAWKFEKNPYAMGYLHLERVNGQTVGSASITPKRIEIHGESYWAAEIGDTFTHPSNRRQGIFTRGAATCTEYGVSNGLNVIYGTPNSLSLPGYENKLHFAQCPFAKVKYLCKYFDVRPIESKIRRKVDVYCVSKVSSHVLLGYLQLRSRLQKRRLIHNRLSIEMLPVEDFRWDLDGLWGESRKDYVFFTIRDKAYLNWRYFANPDEYLFLAGVQNDVCVGYIVVKVSISCKLVIGTICDFITWKDQMDIFNQLIMEAEKQLIAMGVQYIQVLCSEKSPYFQVLFSSGYVIRRSTPIIVFIGTGLGKQMIKDDLKWHFTYADSDMI